MCDIYKAVIDCIKRISLYCISYSARCAYNILTIYSQFVINKMQAMEECLLRREGWSSIYSAIYFFAGLQETSMGRVLWNLCNQ